MPLNWPMICMCAFLVLIFPLSTLVESRFEAWLDRSFPQKHGKKSLDVPPTRI